MKKLLIMKLILVLLLQIPAGLTGQEVQAVHGMVASAHPLASRAGIEILQEGGNAVDAAIATALALAVVEPNASGLGGGGFMLIKLKDQPVISIDYREIAPEQALSSFYYNSPSSFDNLSRSGAHAIAVPGVPAGLTLALQKYGSFSFSQVLAPPTRLAREGFPVSQNLADIIFMNYELIQQDSSLSAIFLKDELPPEAGHIIKNPQLANTFEQLARHGPAIFYHGTIGSGILETVQQAGGLLARTDLINYRAIAKEPVKGRYHDYEIYSTAPPGGGIQLIELLNILENFDLKSRGHNSAEYLHLLAEAMKIVFKDKDTNMADPAFYRIPVEQLLSAEHARELSRQIEPQQATFNYLAPQWIERESGNTTHLSVVDENRNIVALTQSINSWFGSGAMDPQSGILLNNHMADFDAEPGRPNSVEPLKRPVSSIAPTIILKDGEPVLTIGTPGGARIISALAQIIINIIDFEMSIDQAIEAPRIHAIGESLYLEKRISEDIRSELEARGHHLKLKEDYDAYFGGAQGILLESLPGVLTGGADSRRDGSVAGY